MSWYLFSLFLLFSMTILSMEKKYNHVFKYIEDDKYLYIVETRIFGFCVRKTKSIYVNKEFMLKTIIKNHTY